VHLNLSRGIRLAKGKSLIEREKEQERSAFLREQAKPKHLTEWSGSSESIPYRPAKGVFVGLLLFCAFIILFVGFFFRMGYTKRKKLKKRKKKKKRSFVGIL